MDVATGALPAMPRPCSRLRSLRIDLRGTSRAGSYFADNFITEAAGVVHYLGFATPPGDNVTAGITSWARFNDDALGFCVSGNDFLTELTFIHILSADSRTFRDGLFPRTNQNTGQGGHNRRKLTHARLISGTAARELGVGER
jgi:hypothetical protein